MDISKCILTLHPKFYLFRNNLYLINILIFRKMKKILVLLFASVMSFAVQAQSTKVEKQTQSKQAAKAEKKAEIKFVTEEIDYGTIRQGADGVRVFEFTNTGKAPLIISDATSSCGCTVPSYPKNTPIAPGEKGKIEVKYNTNIIGSIRKTVTIISNAAENPNVALRIKGEVIAPESK